jgi:transketolase
MTKLSNDEIRSLMEKSYKCRGDIIKMLRYGEVHIGGAYSCLDVITVLYNRILKHDPKNPEWKDRDRFILSAGHKCLALYTVLADQGYFKEDILWTYNTFNTMVPMHPERKTPGIEFPTGSLGHGLPLANAIALCAPLDKKDYRVFCMLGDGECEEGSVWEAAMAAGHYGTENLIAIVDKNGLQVNGYTKDVMNIDPVEDKFKAFGWAVKTIDGHDFAQIYDALSSVPFEKGKPSCIISNTVKCKGLTYAEDKFQFHHWHCELDEIDEAMEVLEETRREELDRIGK